MSGLGKVPKAMQAWVFKRFGEPRQVLEYTSDWPTPTRKPGQVLIGQSSTSINHVDYKVIRAGGARGAALPKVPGGDLAGIVAQADESSKWQEGDKVFALSTAYAANPHGGWAQYTLAEEDWLASVPSEVDLHTEAGGIPLVSLTAWQALDSSGIQPGTPLRVLVHAGAGGVGVWAVQLAKAHWGAYVVATGGPKNQAFLTQELGADEAFDYTAGDFAKHFADKPFDIIVDVVGGDTELRSYEVLTKAGTYAHIQNSGTDKQRFEAGKQWTHGPKYTYTVVQPNGSQLGQIAQYLADGKIKPIISKVVPLKDAREALEEVEAGHTRGKIVVSLASL